MIVRCSVLVWFACCVALVAQSEPGLVLRFTVEHDGRVLSDEREARMVALTLAEGERPTPFLPAGPLTAEWHGELHLEQRDRYAFTFVGHGRFSLAIDGQVVLQGVSVDGAPLSHEARRLKKGAHTLVASYAPLPGKPRRMRLEWEGRKFRREPIPPTMFRRAPLDSAARLARAGRMMIATHRCTLCHAHDAGDALQMPELAMTGPDLNGVGERLEPSYVQALLRDVHGARPHARMPQVLHGTADEVTRDAADLTAYLMTLTEGPHWEAPADSSAEHGAHVFHDLGCVACHQIGDEERGDPVVPIDLRGVGGKYRPGALAAFLHDPRRHDPWISMPDFDLSPQESVDLAAFLRGLEDESRAAVALGDAARGKRRFESLGCAACHEAPATENRRDAAPLREVLSTFDRGCVADDDAGRGEAPDYGFSAGQRAALREFATRGTTSLLQASSAEFAARQIVERRCMACHDLDDTTDDWTRRQELLDAVGVTGAPHEDGAVHVAQTRPSLTWAGEKLRVEWLDDFLAGRVARRPRPWLRARMPSFPNLADGLSAGLASMHGTPYRTPPEAEPPAGHAEIGRKLVGTQGGFGCTLCHAVADQPPIAVFEVQGVNLLDSGERMRPDFFRRWMWDPPRLDPASKMPQYADPSGKTAFRDVLDGDAEQQFDAIWAFLRSIE